MSAARVLTAREWAQASQQLVKRGTSTTVSLSSVIIGWACELGTPESYQDSELHYVAWLGGEQFERRVIRQHFGH